MWRIDYPQANPHAYLPPVDLVWLINALISQLWRRQLGGRVFGQPRREVKVWLRLSPEHAPVFARQRFNVTTIGPTTTENHPDGGYLLTAPGGWIIDGVRTPGLAPTDKDTPT